MATIGSWESGALPTIAGTVVVDAANSPLGVEAAPSLLIGAATAAAAYARFDFTGVPQAVARTYAKMPAAWPTSGATIFMALKPDNASTLAYIQLGGSSSPGQIRITSQSGTQWLVSPNNTLQVNLSYEFILQVKNTGEVYVRVRTVGIEAPLWEGTVPQATTGIVPGTLIVRSDIGRINAVSTMPPLNFDVLTITDGNIPTPSPHDPQGGEEPPLEPLPPGVVAFWSGGTTLPTTSGDVSLSPSVGVPAASAGSGITIGNGPGASYARLTFTPLGELQTQMYFRTPAAWPSQSWTMCALRPDGGSMAVSLVLSGTGQPGQLRMVTSGGATVAQTGNNTITVDTEYRAVISYNATIGVAQIRVWEVDGDPDPIWSYSHQDTVNWTRTIDRVDYGRATTNPQVGPFLIDNLAVYNSLTIQPLRDPTDIPVVPPPTSYSLYWYGPGSDEPVLQGSVEMMSSGGYPSDAALMIEQEAGATAYAQWNLPDPPANLACRLFIKTPAAWPASAWALIAFRPSTSTNAAVATMSGTAQPGQIRLTSGATTMASAPQNTILPDTWYRVELMQKSATSEANVAIFHLGLGTPLWSSGWIQHASFASPASLIQVGRNGPVPQVSAFRVSDVRITDQVASWQGGGETGGGVTWGVWNGLSLVPATQVQVWQAGQLRNT